MTTENYSKTRWIAYRFYISGKVAEEINYKNNLKNVLQKIY
jgi:antitoxin component YwqK of YwqJK toxin-antitoxin module